MTASRHPYLRNVLIAYVMCGFVVLLMGLANHYNIMGSRLTQYLMLKQTAFLFILYLCGSIPFGLIFTKLFTNRDVREIGSGNIGMTNVMRSGSKIAGILTLVFDVLKAVLPLIILKPQSDSLFVTNVYYFTYLMPVIGHMFPCWLGFKGGKGIATGFGVCLVFFWPLASVMIGLWVLIARFTKLSSLAGLVSFGLFPFATLYFTNMSVAAWTFCLSALVFYAHRDNIGRLLTGQESKFGDPSV